MNNPNPVSTLRENLYPVVLQIITFLLFVTGTTTYSRALAEVNIIDQDLTYTASYGKRNAGSIQIQIRGTDTGYIVTSITKPHKLAGLLLKEHTTEAEFAWRNEELVPISATESLKGKERYDRGFMFDYDNLTVSLSEGRSSTFEQNDQFESVTFPLLLMHRDLAEIENLEIKEVSAKRLRDYTYQKAEQETVKVPAGEFSTWKVTRFRSDRPEDTVVTWLNQSDNPIPVKIAINKDGNTSTLALQK